MSVNPTKPGPPPLPDPGPVPPGMPAFVGEAERFSRSDVPKAEYTAWVFDGAKPGIARSLIRMENDQRPMRQILRELGYVTKQAATTLGEGESFSRALWHEVYLRADDSEYYYQYAVLARGTLGNDEVTFVADYPSLLKFLPHIESAGVGLRTVAFP